MQLRVALPPLFSPLFWHHIRGLASKIQVEYAAIPPKELAMRQRELDQASPLPPTLPANYIGLLAAIRSSASLEQLETLCTSPQTSPFFEPVHTSAALSRLPKVMRFRSKDLQKTDVVLASSLSQPEAHNRQGSSPLGEAGPLTLAPGSLPRIGYSERASALTFHLLGKFLMVEFNKNKPQLFPRQSANIIWALGTLHSMGVSVVEEIEPSVDSRRRRKQVLRKKVPVYPDRFSASLSSRLQLEEGQDNPFQRGIWATMQRMEGAGMSPKFIHGYAAMLHVVCSNSYRPLFAHAQPCEVAQMLKGVALLPRGCQHRGLIRALCAYVAERAGAGGSPGFGPQELRTCAWAIASLADSRRTSSSSIITSLSSSSEGSLPLRQRQDSLSGSLASASALRSIADRLIHDPSRLYESLSPGGIASLMWSFAACHDPTGSKPGVPPETITSLFDLLAQGTLDLGTLAYDLLAQGIAPQSILLKPQDVSMILWASSRVHYTLNPNTLGLLSKKAVSVVEGFRPLELGRTLDAFRAMQMPQAPLLMAVARSLLSEKELDLALTSYDPTLHGLREEGKNGQSSEGDKDGQGSEKELALTSYDATLHGMRGKDRDGQGLGFEALSLVIRAFAQGGLDEMQRAAGATAAAESKSRNPDLDGENAGRRARLTGLRAMRRLRREVVASVLDASLGDSHYWPKALVKVRDQAPETLARLSASLKYLIKEERRLAMEGRKEGEVVKGEGEGEGEGVERASEHEKTLTSLLKRAEFLLPSCTITQLSLLLTALPSKSTWSNTNLSPNLKPLDALPHITSTMYAAAITHLKILLRAMMDPTGKQRGTVLTTDVVGREGSRDEWIEPWIASRIYPRQSKGSATNAPGHHSSEPTPSLLHAEGAGRSRGAMLGHAVRVMTMCKADGGMNDQELVDAVHSLFVESCGASGSFSTAAVHRLGLEACLDILNTCAVKDGSEINRAVKRAVAHATLSLSSADTPPHLLAALLTAFASDACFLAEPVKRKGTERGASLSSASKELTRADLILSMRVVQKLVDQFVSKGLGMEMAREGFVSALNEAIRAASSFSTMPVQNPGIDLEKLMKDLNSLSR